MREEFQRSAMVCQLRQSPGYPDPVAHELLCKQQSCTRNEDVLITCAHVSTTGTR
jgi:hypothetical protein